MAKGKYDRWLTDEGLTLLEGWARDGLTDEQIAHNCGITVKTLYEWKKSYSDICEAIKKGKEVIDYAVENALLKKAIHGDTTAQIFWLKNRRPDKWRDRPIEITDTKQNNLLSTIQASTSEDICNDIHKVQPTSKNSSDVVEQRKLQKI